HFLMAWQADIFHCEGRIGILLVICRVSKYVLLLAKQEYPGDVARNVDTFETELRRLGLHEHWYKDRNEFEQKVADFWGKGGLLIQMLADLGGFEDHSKGCRGPDP
ncbi:MAG: hypothetical protein P1P80_10110, partial [ANME-2 cluster archaeon]|nr:hypothetical protein [ANME-2 cluster archaeon]